MGFGVRRFSNMPIFDLGYRHWKGGLTASWRRWWPITRTGLALTWKSWWFRIWIGVSLIPTLYFAAGFWGIGYLSGNKLQVGDAWQDFLRRFGGSLAKAFLADPDKLRLTLWSVMFDWFFRHAQPFFFMVLVAMVGAALISRDVRTKAHWIYFSKPISLWHYVLGKGAVVGAFGAAVTLLPALLLYVLAVGFSPSYTVLGQTWTLLPKIALCFLAMAVPSMLLVLCLSAWMRSTAFAVIGWVVVWLMGEMMFAALDNVPHLREKSWPLMFSFLANVRVVCHHILEIPMLLKDFDLGGLRRHDFVDPHPLAPSLWYLVIVSAGCLAGLIHKLRSMLSV